MTTKNENNEIKAARNDANRVARAEESRRRAHEFAMQQLHCPENLHGILKAELDRYMADNALDLHEMSTVDVLQIRESIEKAAQWLVTSLFEARSGSYDRRQYGIRSMRERFNLHPVDHNEIPSDEMHGQYWRYSTGVPGEFIAIHNTEGTLDFHSRGYPGSRRASTFCIFVARYRGDATYDHIPCKSYEEAFRAFKDILGSLPTPSQDESEVMS